MIQYAAFYCFENETVNELVSVKKTQFYARLLCSVLFSDRFSATL